MNYMKRLSVKLGMIPSDDEVDRRASVYTEEGRKPSVYQWPEGVQHPVDETNQKLVEFRMLVGISTHGSFKAPRGFDSYQRPVATTRGRPAPNTGIYATVVDSEIKCRKGYRFCSRLINSCLGLQLIVAAALTALGAANSSTAAVTVFGAINTVIAGFLTYLKGSGLPHRLKYFQHEWTKVREYIEQRERDFSMVFTTMRVSDEVTVVRQMFEEVQADIEANTPDRFVGTGNLNGRRPTVAPSPAIAGVNQSEQRSHLGEEITFRLRDLEKEVDGLDDQAVADAHHFVSQSLQELSRMRDVVQQKAEEASSFEQQIADYSRSLLGAKRQQVNRHVDHMDHQMREVGEQGRVVGSGSREAGAQGEQ